MKAVAVATCLASLALASPSEGSDQPCCQGKCEKPGEEKYWSIAKSMLGVPHCGECCMDPKQYPLMHFFEKNLTKSEEDNPCEERGYTKYDSTETHGFGPVKMTLDLYDFPAARTPEEPEPTASEPCCQGLCQEPGHEKYWSIAKGLLGESHCGECCMDPSRYKTMHFFEPNLTKAKEDNPCEVRGYKKYDSTVTHGVGPIKMTLDLYDLGEDKSEPCCQSKCQNPNEEKYWSIAESEKGVPGIPHCGECCMDPKLYTVMHFFEKNLTKSEEDNPCEVRGFTKYDSTVTHGVWPVRMTLDLYDLPSMVMV